MCIRVYNVYIAIEIHRCTCLPFLYGEVHGVGYSAGQRTGEQEQISVLVDLFCFICAIRTVIKVCITVI